MKDGTGSGAERTLGSDRERWRMLGCCAPRFASSELARLCGSWPAAPLEEALALMALDGPDGQKSQWRCGNEAYCN
jgi:hypothetical protein